MPIDSHLSYLQKNAFLPPQIAIAPDKDLALVVVIPCHDEPDLCGSLEALAQCQPPNGAVEVIVVINAGQNHSDAVKQQNQLSLQEAMAWKLANDRQGFITHLIHVDALPPKHAGVGLARKIGMDEAVRRFEALGRDGIIVCFDADSRCQANYLQAIDAHFLTQPKAASASIHFEHPIEGEWEPEVLQGIIRYELYLRYYRLALQWAGHPHAWHCIGSSMAVRSSAYQEQGGMNRRKAGEDFYFLQKYIQLGRHSEINTTQVIPSPRASHRVPFGTGKAISAYLGAPTENYPVIAFSAFADFRVFLSRVSEMRNWEKPEFEEFERSLPKNLGRWVKEAEVWKMVKEAQANTISEASFRHRFFRNLDALKALQYFHFCQSQGLPDQPIADAVAALAKMVGILEPSNPSLASWLKQLRAWECGK